MYWPSHHWGTLHSTPHFFFFSTILVRLQSECSHISASASFLLFHPLQKSISGLSLCLPGTGFERWARTQGWVWRIHNNWSKLQCDLHCRTRSRVRNFQADMIAEKTLPWRRNSRWVSTNERGGENNIPGQREIMKDVLTYSRDWNASSYFLEIESGGPKKWGRVWFVVGFILHIEVLHDPSKTGITHRFFRCR